MNPRLEEGDCGNSLEYSSRPDRSIGQLVSKIIIVGSKVSAKISSFNEQSQSLNRSSDRWLAALIRRLLVSMNQSWQSVSRIKHSSDISARILYMVEAEIIVVEPLCILQNFSQPNPATNPAFQRRKAGFARLTSRCQYIAQRLERDSRNAMFPFRLPFPSRT